MPSPVRVTWPIIVALGVGLASGLAGSCRNPPVASPEPLGPPVRTLTLRLYAIANLASALEPCGCQKDMLGGLDHAAQVLANERSEVDQTLVVAAGPTFFLNPTSFAEGQQQDTWKAEALARSLRDIDLAGWTPGANDFGRTPTTAELAELAGAPWLGANVEPSSNQHRETLIVERGWVRVGLAGASVPRSPNKTRANTKVNDPEPGLRRALEELRQRGAQLFIALLAVPRGEALRIVDRVPGFHVAVVGKPYQEGDGNDAPSPPIMIGDTLVIQPSNLLQTLGVVDFRLVDGDWKLEDAGGIAITAEREHLERRTTQLQQRLAVWEATGANQADIAARRRDLARLRAELAALDTTSRDPAGSWFRYSLREVRESVGVNARVSQRIDEFYRRVNDHNRVALAHRTPPPVPAGTSGYVGSENCIECHESADAFWRTTRHANAYATLAELHTEYNLECVGCHVTGYERPGGATVANVKGLQNVQCEVCHGPGSLHVERPGEAELIALTPENTLCASQCHKPPHVPEGWNVEAKWPLIIGPGHGAPLPEPPSDEGKSISADEALKLLEQ